MPETSVSLLEKAEPIFQYVCRLNRLSRTASQAKSGDTSFLKKGSSSIGFSLEYSVVRAEVNALLEDFASKSSADVRLAAQVAKMELPMIFFVDSMISECGLPLSAEWNQKRLAYDRKELAGDQKFFDLLEETIEDSSDEASERLAIYYICIGLGFTGIHFNQPEYLRQIMLTIAPRIRHIMEADHSAKICPEAYEGIDTRDLIQPPGSKVALLGVVLLSFILAVVLTYVYMYSSASNTLDDAMQAILDQDLSKATILSD